jgi:cytochrome c-type biogenesis protein CcmH
MYKYFLLLLLILSSVFTANAVEHYLPEPQEKRAKSLFRQIRCLVCEGESIAESRAELAVDLRENIRHQITGGSDNQDILNKLAASYGQQILMKPPLTPATLGLWGAPLLLLMMGMAGIFIAFRK